jgi:hypothetical protein
MWFLTGCVLFAATAGEASVGTVRVMGYASDLTDEQWALLEPVFNAPGKRGPKHAPDLRRVVDAMLYISHTGCQWRFLPESFGPWTLTAACECVSGGRPPVPNRDPKGVATRAGRRHPTK